MKQKSNRRRIFEYSESIWIFAIAFAEYQTLAGQFSLLSPVSFVAYICVTCELKPSD